MTTAPSPLAAYRRILAQGERLPDAAQEAAVLRLEACHAALLASRPTRGLYLWGPVGRGKTWLLDLFHASLPVPAHRQHFHHFMRWVHQRQFQLSGTRDPLQVLARELAAEVRVLCFDELFVSDIGDAILVGGLLRALLDQGLVLVVTSNQPPEQLYAGGFNRERLLPAIAALQAQLDVLEVDGGQDHRLHQGHAEPRFWVDDPTALATTFARLTAGEAVTTAPLILGERALPVVQRASGAIWLDFTVLCQGAWATTDYMDLCTRFPALLLSGVPCLSGDPRAAASPAAPKTARRGSWPATANCPAWRPRTTPCAASSPWSTKPTTAAARSTWTPPCPWISCTPAVFWNSPSAAP